MNNYAIVYSSQTGNTAQLAEALRSQLPTENCLYFGPPDEAALEASVLFVSFWTNKGTADGKTQAFLQKLHQKTILLFGTAGFGGQREYFQQILQRVALNIPEDNQQLLGFLCQGKMPLSIRQRYEKMLAENPNNPQIHTMLQNFDQALSHPNQADLTQLAQWAKTNCACL